MSTVDVDSRGRIYLPKDMREEHGDKFKIVQLESGIKLIPIDEDPVEGLRKAMNAGKDVDLEALSDKVEESAREELSEEF